MALFLFRVRTVKVDETKQKEGGLNDKLIDVLWNEGFVDSAFLLRLMWPNEKAVSTRMNMFDAFIRVRRRCNW